MYRTYLKWQYKLQEWILYRKTNKKININVCPGMSGFELKCRFHSKTNAVSV